MDDFQATLGLVVEKERVAKGGEYNLSGERYRNTSSGNSDFPMVPLGQVARFIRGITFRKSDQLERETEGSLPVVTTKAAQESGIIEEALYHIPRSLLKDDNKLLRPGDILISTANSLHLLGRTTHVQDINRSVSFGAFVSVIRPNSCVLDTYLIHCLRTEFAADFFLRNANTTTNISNLNLSTLAEFLIPLAPLEVQQEIVAEIEGYQRVINGARAVVDNYRPRIRVDPAWPTVALGKVCSLGGGITKEVDLGRPYFGADSIESNSGKLLKVETAQAQGVNGPVYEFAGQRLLYSKIRPYLNKLAIVDLKAYCSSDMYPLLPDRSKILTTYLATYMLSEGFNEDIRYFYERASIPKINRSQLFKVGIPLPPLETQRAIVAEIQGEQAIIEANRGLIERFEKKIQEAIAQVWNEA